MKDNFIVLDILHRDFNNNFAIRKYQEIGYIFLNNQKSYEKIITEINIKITRHTRIENGYCKTKKAVLSIYSPVFLAQLNKYHLSQAIFQ